MLQEDIHKIEIRNKIQKINYIQYLYFSQNYNLN